MIQYHISRSSWNFKLYTFLTVFAYMLFTSEQSANSSWFNTFQNNSINRSQTQKFYGMFFMRSPSSISMPWKISALWLFDRWALACIFAQIVSLDSVYNTVIREILLPAKFFHVFARIAILFASIYAYGSPIKTVDCRFNAQVIEHLW